MNRRAVAFAADSAMTISATGKTYNSADKIFEISHHNPIGLMLFNSLDYMGMPLDVIIKRFREADKDNVVDYLTQAPEVFFDYLMREFSILHEDEDLHVYTLTSVILSQVYEKFFSTAVRRVVGTRRRTAAFLAVFRETVEEFIAEMNVLADCECYFDLTLDDFIDRYNHVFVDAISSSYETFPIEDNDKDRLKVLAALSLKKSYYSPLQTGFVFAGFGMKELFPSLQSFTFDGMIMGRLKRMQRELVEIDANNVRAKIVPFAQHEMVDRFLVGIDERHERTIIDNVRLNLETVGDTIIRSLPGIRRQTRTRLRTNLRTSIDTVLDDLREKTIRDLKDESTAESEDAVMFMAKPDLGNLAEALVNITSVKRRASLETESVGGPIDVAVISKDDGFVWVKRKHYFEPDLNPRFFARKFGGIGQRKGGRHDES